MLNLLRKLICWFSGHLLVHKWTWPNTKKLEVYVKCTRCGLQGGKGWPEDKEGYIEVRFVK